MWQIWLIAAGVFLILEMFTMGFLVFWLGIGSLLAMLVSFIAPSSIILQTAVFVLSSGILIFATKTEQVNRSKGTDVEIESIEGVKAFVTPLNENIQN